MSYLYTLNINSLLDVSFVNIFSQSSRLSFCFLDGFLCCAKLLNLNPKGDKSWMFIGRTDWCLAETPILWPPDVKSWLIWKKPWCWERLRAGEGDDSDEVVGWHHWVNGHGFGWTPEVGDGPGGLVCAVHGVTKSQTWLSNWTELNWGLFYLLLHFCLKTQIHNNILNI